MTFVRPTLQELITRVEGDLKAELGLTNLPRRSVERALGVALAGLSHLEHGHLKEISKQAFPDQSTGVILDRWGAIYGILKTPATFATLTIAGTGTDTTVIPVDTIFQTSLGLTYKTLEEVTITSGVYSVNIQAEVSGDSSNLIATDTVTLQGLIVGVDSMATVTAVVLEGEEQETEESHRLRIVERIQFPPAGGKVTDYIAWGKEVSGVSRVWVFPGNRGAATVDVSFLELDGGEEVIPSTAKVAELQEYINTKKPSGIETLVFAPGAATVNMTIRLEPNTTAVQTAVETELKDLFRRENEINNAIDPDQVGLGIRFDGRIPISKIREAISIASGEEDHILVTPTVDIQPAQGSIAVLGTITFGFI